MNEHPKGSGPGKADLFSQEEALIEEVIPRLTGMFGPTDWVSPGLPFDRTRYYEKEMGWPLHRRFISFMELVSPADLAEIKLRTNDVEKNCRVNGKRRINIDPGYVALERLVLATGKNYTHRIYLSRGIYADLTLIFQRGSFRPLEWTYKDYADEKVIGFFNDVRGRYKNQLRGIEN